jgi:hypothetical protein
LHFFILQCLLLGRTVVVCAGLIGFWAALLCLLLAIALVSTCS